MGGGGGIEVSSSLDDAMGPATSPTPGERLDKHDLKTLPSHKLRARAINNLFPQCNDRAGFPWGRGANP